MNPLWEAIVIGLASWRATAMISYERGPADLFLRLRRALGFSHDEGGKPTAWPDNALANAIACPWCAGLWLAAAFWGLWQVSEAAVVMFAAAAVLVGAERWNNG